MALDVPVPEALTVPCEAGEEMLQVRVSESASVAFNVRLKGFGEPSSDTVTSVTVPNGVDGKQLVSRMRTEHNVILGGGQGPLEGKIFRIGHLGWVGRSEIDGVMDALRSVLSFSA